MSAPSLIQQTFIEQRIQSTVLDGENQDNNTASLVTSYSQANAVIVKSHSTLEIDLDSSFASTFKYCAINSVKRALENKLFYLNYLKNQ